MPYLPETNPSDLELLVAFGRRLKYARSWRGLSQHGLERRARVDQTAISRVERALAPAFPLRRLVRLGDALGSGLPLGYCPHPHDCAWAAPEVHRQTEATWWWKRPELPPEIGPADADFEE
jgi:hypothetical protein